MAFLIEVGGVRVEVRGLSGLVTLAGIGLLVTALVEQLKRPPTERTWHGRLWGTIPYDFRPPTLARIARAAWNPQSDRVLSEKMFGVGWDVNLAAASKKLSSLKDAAQRLAAR